MNCDYYGKIKYATNGDAVLARSHFMKRNHTSGNLNIFECSHCGGWHLGRSRSKTSKTVRRWKKH